MSRSIAPALLLAMSASLAAGPPSPEPGGCGGAHIVVRGDTLYSIARRCRSTVVAIAQASRIADPRRIEVGQRLVIPGQSAPAAVEPGKEELVAESGLSYRFTAGDTIYSLARWARVGVGALISANPGINPHKIEIGDAVRLPAGAVAPDAARLRERGTGPGPAFVRPDQVMLRQNPVPPARLEADRRRPAPPPLRAHVREYHPLPAPPPPAPRRDKPEDEDPRAPEGM